MLSSTFGHQENELKFEAQIILWHAEKKVVIDANDVELTPSEYM